MYYRSRDIAKLQPSLSRIAHNNSIIVKIAGKNFPPKEIWKKARKINIMV